MPKVSVIVPVYNSEKYIKETIESILAQDFKDFELIIINDVSTDNSLKIIQEFKQNKQVKIFSNKINKGRAGSINVGLKKASGEYITFSDSDDLFYPERLKKQIEFLDLNPKVDMIYGDILIFWENGEEKVYKALEFKDITEPLQRLKQSAENKNSFDQAYKALDKENFIPGSSIMFRKKLIEQGIKMDENLRNSEDCDFNYQIIGAGYKIKKLPIITFKYRKHAEQKSKDKEKMNIAKEYIIKKLRSGKYFKTQNLHC